MCCLLLVLQEVQGVLAVPGKVSAMLAGGVPWWQILYTGLMSTDAVLMIEVRGPHRPIRRSHYVPSCMGKCAQPPDRLCPSPVV